MSASIILRYRAQMPRRPRIQLDKVPLHVVQRGHNREACFFSEEDYQSYLHWLGEALAEHECALHAYALMTNLVRHKSIANVSKLTVRGVADTVQPM